MPSQSFPRVYLAGPLTDACEEFGMEALCPFEAACNPGSPQQIFDANMRMLRRADGPTGRRADGMIANLTPFRGAEPDAGTVFEVGPLMPSGSRSWRTVWALEVTPIGFERSTAQLLMKRHPARQRRSAGRRLGPPHEPHACMCGAHRKRPCWGASKAPGDAPGELGKS
jgi:hypothetical protein